MTATNGLNLAKQGNPEAIAALINKSLQPKGITVSAAVAGNCLTLIAESQTAPEKAALVEFIHQGISNLNLKAIERIVIQGKVAGQKQSSWREMVELKTPQANGTGKASIVTSNHEPKKTVLEQLVALRDYANTALLAGILLTLIANGMGANRTQKTLWEYQIEGISDASFDVTMQQRGAEGWELASARRAVSGEGASSEGLYEVILRRPTTESQAKQNLKDSQSKLEEQKLVAMQIEAKTYIGALNRGQQAHALEKNAFASSVTDLEIGVPLDSENYSYSVVLEGKDKAIATATPKRADLKGFTGAVTRSGYMSKAIVCQSDAPSTAAPASPTLSGSSLQCAAGSSEP